MLIAIITDLISEGEARITMEIEKEGLAYTKYEYANFFNKLATDLNSVGYKVKSKQYKTKYDQLTDFDFSKPIMTLSLKPDDNAAEYTVLPADIYVKDGIYSLKLRTDKVNGIFDLRSNLTVDKIRYWQNILQQCQQILFILNQNSFVPFKVKVISADKSACTEYQLRSLNIPILLNCSENNNRKTKDEDSIANLTAKINHEIHEDIEVNAFTHKYNHVYFADLKSEAWLKKNEAATKQEHQDTLAKTEFNNSKKENLADNYDDTAVVFFFANSDSELDKIESKFFSKQKASKRLPLIQASNLF